MRDLAVLDEAADESGLEPGMVRAEGLEAIRRLLADGYLDALEPGSRRSESLDFD